MNPIFIPAGQSDSQAEILKTHLDLFVKYCCPAPAPVSRFLLPLATTVVIGSSVLAGLLIGVATAALSLS